MASPVFEYGADHRSTVPDGKLSAKTHLSEQYLAVPSTEDSVISI